ncbi:MAG: glycoside hydrolase family 3 C-terminal domain-containing protein [Paludibacter sp.]|nr:glycoside hydrolase family 3 C-terminal domain-containing protein [Paludibacter sp.]
MEKYKFKPFKTPISLAIADKRADSILSLMTLAEKIEMIGGHNSFMTKGFKKYNIPEFEFSDATQGVHIRKDLNSTIQKSTAFPCPLALTATWNPSLANSFAKSIGEECRANNVAVLLGPGMNIYRISQNGRNFEYFGEDPFLAARMIENYVVGMQSTGTITTLKHFLCNNTDFHRRRTNSVVGERAIHEIYLPAFKAGVDAGAMAVMTSYNQVNGEWAGQNSYVINQLLKKELGFKGVVMTDWWSVYDPEKVIKSGMDLEMPGEGNKDIPDLAIVGDIYLRTNAARLIKEGKATEADVTRMAKNMMRAFIAMGDYDRPVKDASYMNNYPEHEKVALQTAREGIVLLRNEKNILPLSATAKNNILVVGKYVENIARGLGSAEVEGYNNISMIDALRTEFGTSVTYAKEPTEEQLKAASFVVVSIGTSDSEGWDKPFEIPAEGNALVEKVASLNNNMVVVVNAGGGLKMTEWNTKVPAIIYGWYAGQNGYTALAEILSGKTNPSGKLPITIEKQFEDSPGFGYIPKGMELYTGWGGDVIAPKIPVFDINYKEGIFVGYRWYESKKIEPLYHFGFGLSYTTFGFSNMKVSNSKISKTAGVTVSFELKNTGKKAGAEVAQLYIQALNPKVERPLKELKAFSKVELKAGESKLVTLHLKSNDFAYWDVKSHAWKVDAGNYNLLLGSASNDILQTAKVTIN